MILAIDTSTRNASVALSEGPGVVAGRSWRSSVNHTTELMPGVSQLMDGRGVRPQELDAVAVALGPGGFSALRTGLSAAKGLAMAAGIPIVGIGSLDLEAFPYRESGLAVCALLEAGRSEAASALIALDGSRLREDRITGPDELLEEIGAMSFDKLRTRDRLRPGGLRINGGDGPVLFCGEGMPPWSESIQAVLGGRAVLCHTPPSARAGSLAALAFERLERGDTDDLDALQPHYLRMPSIGVPKRRDRRLQASSRRRTGANETPRP